MPSVRGEVPGEVPEFLDQGFLIMGIPLPCPPLPCALPCALLWAQPRALHRWLASWTSAV